MTTTQESIELTITCLKSILEALEITMFKVNNKDTRATPLTSLMNLLLTYKLSLFSKTKNTSCENLGT